MRMGSITTDIIKNGLIWNIDPANRASYVPNATTTFNTTNLSQFGSLTNGVSFNNANKGIWEFDGSDDWIELDSFILNTDAAWSISLWTNLDDFSYSYPELFILKTNEATGFTCFMGNASSYTGINFGSNSNFAKFKTTGDISGDLVGAWVNIILTYNGNDKATSNNYIIYVNGASVLNTATGTFAAVDNRFSNIGVGNTNNYFDGNIGPVHIYNRALSSTEVLHNYNALKSRFE